MTFSPTWATTASVATVLAIGLLSGGCGSGGGGEERALPEPSAPQATGTGPYPTPSAPRTDAPALPEPTEPGEPTEPTSTATPRGSTVRPQEVDGTDADAVGEGALRALWTYDTTTDSGPRDAEMRAAEAGWLTGEYADQVRAERPPSVPGVQWREWAGHRARTTVGLKKTEDAAKPPDTGNEAWRQWTVTATPKGREGWTGDPVVSSVYVRLTRTTTDKPWRVAEVTVR
ncbi:hypothetical protein [Streptomyces sp. IB2014 016-6]|uniref:hypothetical protein n=1 Tax=Streptomyces sp. IB2014 016-6 TaxID=2517818 RepID=UPI0011CA26F0|nr:hypothetical protein [Streptomyces sp. IB2014 016-6]TXL83760.1 hypothetical protein EW053_36690 [Streptomyces sp. IB2014 016-6]